VAEMDLRGSEDMRSRLVGTLAAIALVAATWWDVGMARADGIPIHRGLPNAGYGEPEPGGGDIRSPLLVFRIFTVQSGAVTFALPLKVGGRYRPRLTGARPLSPEGHSIERRAH
jgi:hypothetical protein